MKLSIMGKGRIKKDYKEGENIFRDNPQQNTEEEQGSRKLLW